MKSSATVTRLPFPKLTLSSTVTTKMEPSLKEPLNYGVGQWDSNLPPSYPEDNWLREQAQSLLGVPCTIEEAKALAKKFNLTTRQPIEPPTQPTPSRFAAWLRSLRSGQREKSDG